MCLKGFLALLDFPEPLERWRGGTSQFLVHGPSLFFLGLLGVAPLFEKCGVVALEQVSVKFVEAVGSKIYASPTLEGRAALG